MRSDSFRDEALAAWGRGVIGGLEITLEHAFAGLSGRDLELVERAESEGFLVGHGVHYSPLSHTWTALDADWLARVADLARERRFRWVTEHCGICRAGGIWSAPLPAPYTRATVERGVERLRRLHEAVRVPVGLENLALAWSGEDARRQADLMRALLEPVDGVMVLDLHNLWCQIVNYGLDPVQHLERWPLDRVRQLHLSGGSWSRWPEGVFRRDTHDGPVPVEVWDLLPEAVARCPALELVTLERLGPAIDSDPAGWRSEVARLGEVERVRGAGGAAESKQIAVPLQGDPAAALDAIFEARGPVALREAGGPWLVDADPRAVRTAAELRETWGRPI